jgi:hypothetical protein
VSHKHKKEETKMSNETPRIPSSYNITVLWNGKEPQDFTCTGYKLESDIYFFFKVNGAFQTVWAKHPNLNMILVNPVYDNELSLNIDEQTTLERMEKSATSIRAQAYNDWRARTDHL